MHSLSPQSMQFSKMMPSLAKKLEDVTAQHFKPLRFSWNMHDRRSNNSNCGILYFSKDMPIFLHLVFTTALKDKQNRCCIISIVKQRKKRNDLLSVINQCWSQCLISEQSFYNSTPRDGVAPLVGGVLEGVTGAKMG